ncbi:MAG: hypothetical protein V4527_13595 [Pseudomonadota bacterium]
MTISAEASEEAPDKPKREFGAWPLAFHIAWQIWAAHAVVFFAHEYAHSLTAWLLGWKTNPLALNYGHFSSMAVLIQLGIDQNVDEIPIFNSGHGVQAAIISGAGLLVGNLFITLPLSRWGYHIAKKRSAKLLGMFCYWATIASIGNLVDYIPIRTFTDGTDLYQDMFAVEKGLNTSAWALLVILGIPFLFIVAYFLLRIMPDTIKWLFPKSPNKRIAMAVLTALFLFGFYGAAGLLGGGPVSYWISLACVSIVTPIVSIFGVFAMARR